MSFNPNLKSKENIIDLLKHFEENRGVSVNQIINFVVEKFGFPKSDISGKIKIALLDGLDKGLLVQKDGLFSINKIEQVGEIFPIAECRRRRRRRRRGRGRSRGRGRGRKRSGYTSLAGRPRGQRKLRSVKRKAPYRRHAGRNFVEENELRRRRRRRGKGRKRSRGRRSRSRRGKKRNSDITEENEGQNMDMDQNKNHSSLIENGVGDEPSPGNSNFHII